MSENRRSKGTRRNYDVDEIDGALELLRRHLDALSGEPTPSREEARADKEWVAKLAGSGILHRAKLHPEAIDLIAEIIPPSSVTDDSRSRLERRRMRLRGEMRAREELEHECRASSPPDLFKELRERAGLSEQHVAAVFGVTRAIWIAVECKQTPWYQLRAEAVPAFATAVREPLDRLIDLITIVARRAVYHGIERRIGLALGRFDRTQKVSEARRDTLRVAFALVQAENRGAAGFLDSARQAATSRAESPPSQTRQSKGEHK